MKLPKYPLSKSDDMTAFEFVSEGPKGHIDKLVLYQPTNLRNIYNLVFGDVDHITGNIDDRVVSNNKDSEKILASVASTVYFFTDNFPDALIYVTGSTKSRTRLYRMGITKFLSEIEKDFDILGERNESWEKFRKDIEYESFLVRRKKK